jgi:hypothetical protein
MKKDGEGFDFIFLEGLVLEGKSMLVFKFFFVLVCIRSYVRG